MSHACPPDVAAKILAGLVETEALRVALEWLESPSKVLVLQGGTGSGKSVAAGWLHEFFRARPLHSDAGARRVPAWFAAKVLGTLDHRDRETVETWRAFDAATLIVLDDVGTEPWADRIGSAIERVWDVTSARLVVTTNLRLEVVVPPDGPGRYGERVASRMQGARWEELVNGDYRGRPPTGNAWPAPAARTQREHDAAEARRIAEEAEAAEYESGAAARDAAFAHHMAWLRDTIAELEAAKAAERSAPERADDEARRRLRAQLKIVGGEP